METTSDSRKKRVRVEGSLVVGGDEEEDARPPPMMRSTSVLEDATIPPAVRVVRTASTGTPHSSPPSSSALLNGKGEMEGGGSRQSSLSGGATTTATGAAAFEELRDVVVVNNPTPQISAAPSTVLSGANGDRLVLVMVGLPARGKTYIARRISQYLSFFHGATCRVFNVGTYRRAQVGAKTPAEFFRSDNEQGASLRRMLAQMCMSDLKAWLAEATNEGRVAIYDATNTTRERRDWILKELSDLIPSRWQIVFVESVVNDESLVDHNVREVKVSMPDYSGMKEDEAVADFRARIAAYNDRYEPLGAHPDDQLLSWVRVEDGGRFMAMNRIRGYLQGRICQLLSTLHTIRRPIYLSRHGQSEYNKLNKIGGDSPLSAEGESYAVDLAKFVHKEILGLNEDGSFPNPKNRVCSHARLYTSSLRRTIETARHIVHPVCDDGWIPMRPKIWRNLDEIFAGVFDGMTYEEIQKVAPEEFEERARAKLKYRYPRGESYLDVIERLEPVVMELERASDPVLIVGHQGILRILYAYFTGKSREQAPFVPIPLNTVIKLIPGTYTCEEEVFLIGKAPAHSVSETVASDSEPASSSSSSAASSDATPASSYQPPTCAVSPRPPTAPLEDDPQSH